jgi:hypothetical protein
MQQAAKHDERVPTGEDCTTPVTVFVNWRRGQ